MIRPAIVVVALLTMFDPDLKKMLPDADGIKKSTKKLDKAAREKVEKALGVKLEDKDIPSITEARATVASVGAEKTRVLFCIVTAKGAKGDVKLGVAVAPDDGRIACIKILDNKDDKTLENATFWHQFEGFEYAPSLTKPASALEEARKKGQGGGELGSHLSLTQKMHSVQTDIDILKYKIDKEEDGAAEPARRVRDLFGEVDKMVPAFNTFLQKGQIERFQAAMKASQKDVDAVAAAMKDKKWSDANSAMHRLENEQCARCHAWSRSRFGQRREELGIGNGFFVIGHELTAAAEGPRESFQTLATAVRRAVLVMTEAK